MTNKEFAEQDRIFRLACKEAKIEPTPRQASKFRHHKGLAYSKKEHATYQIDEETQS